MKDRNKNITVIGLVLEDIFADFSKELISNVRNAIPDHEHIRLVVLPGRYYNPEIPSEIHDYNRIYNSVFEAGEICDFDGFIVHIGNLSTSRSHTIDESLVADFKKVPSVFIATNIENVTTVNYDNEAGIREAVECLVNINGLSRLCMLGGRSDNFDSILRKEIFIRCLEENGIRFSEENFIHTDMSFNCVAEATELLEKNPHVQAIFCVNDAAAKGLYTAMAAKGLVPGRDILVFGFDNTMMSTELIPSLSSIGCDRTTLGQKALELLLKKMNGEKAESAMIQTRLYGRESFDYEMYDYTVQELTEVNPAFIYRMFDDCFYRYRTEQISRENVNLRRLFVEFITKMLQAQKNRYMSPETFQEISRLIRIFFEKGAMKYTDAPKLLKSIERLQAGVNFVMPNVMLNRLFSEMKDQAIHAISNSSIRETGDLLESRIMMKDYLIAGMMQTGRTEFSREKALRAVSRLGLQNAALFMFEKPVCYHPEQETVYPKTIRLCCVMKDGNVFYIDSKRQSCPISGIFYRHELSSKCSSFALFPIFYADKIYGYLLCGLTNDIFNSGEYIALLIGQNFYISDLHQRMLRAADTPADRQHPAGQS
ncbi:MAG: LacI family DNA-binding transcriptional regulator [Oscillospiraceae bacterium]|nr:LacI family DNA-binding transcriptional regulator [Oscillospiraceae bacterium]